jgi:hypothetical protein
MADDYEAARDHYNFVLRNTNDANQRAAAKAAMDAAAKRRKPVNSLAPAKAPQGNWLGRLTGALGGSR